MAIPGPIVCDTTNHEVNKLHRKLLFTTIAIEYLHETIENGLQKDRFIAASKKYFRTEIEDSMEDVGEILRHFERTGHVGIGNYNVLKEIVQFNVKIVEEIKKTETAMRTLGGSVISQTDDGCDEYLIAEVKNSTVHGEEWHTASSDMMKIHLHLQDHNIKLVSLNSDQCEWFSTNLQTHHDLMKESNTILRQLQPDERDERIKSFVELAKKSKDLLVSHDEDFHKFVTRWRTLNRSLIEDCELILLLQGKGAKFKGLLQSSLFIFLHFGSIQMLDSFWNEYNSGLLNEEIQVAVCADRSSENMNPWCFLTLNEGNYHRYRTYLEKSLKKEANNPWRDYESNILEEQRSLNEMNTTLVTKASQHVDSSILSQTSVVCGRCRKSEDVLWFCKHCPSSLCDACAGTHKTIPQCEDHVVIPRNYSTLRLYGPAKLAEQCQIHPEKEIISYCNVCRVPCCILCLVEEHRSHDISTIERKFLDAERSLNHYAKSLATDVRSTLDRLEEEEREDVRKSNENKQEVVNDINAFRTEVIQNFNEACDCLISQVENISDKNDIGLREIETMKDKSESVKREVEEKLLAGKLDLIEYKPPDLESFIPKIFFKKFLLTFLPDRKALQVIRDKVGKIELQGNSNEEMEKSYYLKPLMQNSFKCKIRIISIVKANDSMAWVMGCESSTMHLYNVSGEVVKSVTLKESKDIYDMAITRSQDMIVTSEYKKVRCVSGSGKVSTLIDTIPFVCYGVCLTYKDEIVVCLGGQSERNHVAVYSPDGCYKLREVRGVDSQGKHLITDPYRVEENYRDLCVVNFGSNVICVNEEDGVKWVYVGTPAKLNKPFGPRCICVDKFANLLITDIRNNCVHYIDRTGGLIQVILTKEETGLHSYWGICVDDNTGQLWVGNAIREIVIAKYLT